MKTKKEIIDEIIKEPFVELSDHSQRLRRNMLLLSALAFVLSVQDLDSIKTFLGFSFEPPIDSHFFYIIVLIFLLFESVNFFLHGYLNTMKWRLRLTGLSEHLKNIGKSIKSDTDPFWGSPDVHAASYISQSTAFSEISDVFTSLSSSLQKIKEKEIQQLITEISNHYNILKTEKDNSQLPLKDHILRLADTSNKLITQLTHSKNIFSNILAQQDVVGNRMDKFTFAFCSFSKFQYFRYWLLDFGIPLGIAAVTSFMLIRRLI